MTICTPLIEQYAENLQEFPVPINISEQVNTVANHIGVILRYRPRVQAVVKQLQSGVSNQVRENISASYSAYYQAKQREAGLYKVLLAAAVIVLTIYVLFFIVRLKRLTVSLDRANGEFTELNRTLERRVQERSEELHTAQKDLVRSERLAALGQLTATVSHELRNPLGALRSSLFVIKGKTEESGLKLERPVGRAERSIQRCDNIITEMLDFARASEIDPEIGHIDAWLDDTIGELAVPAGITLRRTALSPEAQVSFDGERLRRAVINVFENACQAMDLDFQKSGSEKSYQLSVTTEARRGRFRTRLRRHGQRHGRGNLGKDFRAALQHQIPSAPGWVCRPSSRSWNSMAAASRSRAKSVPAPPLRCGCQLQGPEPER